MAKDRIGEVYGRLEVVSFSHISDSGHAYWKCLCECGKWTTVRGGHLSSGNTSSCGCYRHDIQLNNKRALKHGGYYTPEYVSYRAAKARCEDPNDSSYQYYGGRGIKFLYKDFAEFFADVGPRPEGHSIDRIDPDGDYGPGLCRWADVMTQRHNRRDSKKVAA